MSVADDSTTTFRAIATDAAGNPSGCSSPVAYVEDSKPPLAPTLIASTPASPADDNAPRIKGSADSDSTVRLYANGDCSGSPVATGSAADFAAPGLAASVADDTKTTFRAAASDAAGNVSSCSTSSLAYEERSHVLVSTDMQLTSRKGAAYIALPSRPAQMTATFSVSSSSSYQGPLKLRLSLRGLKVKSKLPTGVKLAADKQTATWTIASLPASPIRLTGVTRVKQQATFGIQGDGAGQVSVVGQSRVLRRATGRVRLEKPRARRLSNGDQVTFRGTIAAPTCDEDGRGKLQLRVVAPRHRPSPLPDKVKVSEPAAGSDPVCTFEVRPTFPELGPFAGDTLRFWVVSTVRRAGRVERHRSPRRGLTVADKP